MRRIATKGTETKKIGIIPAIWTLTSPDAPNNAPRLSRVRYMTMQPTTDSINAKRRLFPSAVWLYATLQHFVLSALCTSFAEQPFSAKEHQKKASKHIALIPFQIRCGIYVTITPLSVVFHFSFKHGIKQCNIVNHLLHPVASHNLEHTMFQFP